MTNSWGLGFKCHKLSKDVPDSVKNSIFCPLKQIKATIILCHTKKLNMKTQKQNYLKAILLGFIFLMSLTGKSQITWPYPITNSLGCDVIICYEVEDQICGWPICDPCPVGGITISAGATYYLNGASCTALPILDVHVVIKYVDGVAPSASCTAVGDPNTCIISCGGSILTGLTVPAPSNCGTVSISYSSTGTIIY
jgi:hypothetical protein